jgi:rhodanese-related sulfurtransferase
MMNFLRSMLTGSSRDFDVSEAAAAIEAGAPLVDVREPDEFAHAAIPGATNVPLGRIRTHGADALRSAGIDIEATMIVLVCRSGARSGNACAVLHDALGGRTRNLAGGVLAWGSRGLPLTPSGRAVARSS